MVASVLYLCFMQPVLGQAPSAPAPRQDIPGIYVVKKGDTLWDIAQTFFGDPLTWPDIWKRNPFINDPHWIYPGQELTLGDVVRMLSEAAPPQPEPEEPVVEVEPEPVVVSPPTPPTRIIQAAPPAETAAAAPATDTNVLMLLDEPQPAYRRETYMRTGFITRRSEIPRNRVVGIGEEGNSATQYDTITVDIPPGGSIRPGSMLAVLTVGDQVKHPDTGDDLGVVMRVKGIAEVVSQVDGQSLCRVTENFDPILMNDRVMPASISEAPIFDAWVKPERTIRATILAINEPLISIHISDIIYIDRGSNDGVSPGDRFTIYSRADDRAAANDRPAMGELQAVNVMPTETAVMVVSMRDNTIRIGDRAELTARCRIIR